MPREASVTGAVLLVRLTITNRRASLSASLFAGSQSDWAALRQVQSSVGYERI